MVENSIPIPDILKLNTGPTSVTMSELLSVSNIVEGIFIPFVATFGILGNLASICVLRDNRLEMKATFR